MSLRPLVVFQGKKGEGAGGGCFDGPPPKPTHHGMQPVLDAMITGDTGVDGNLLNPALQWEKLKQGSGTKHDEVSSSTRKVFFQLRYFQLQLR